MKATIYTCAVQSGKVGPSLVWRWKAKSNVR